MLHSRFGAAESRYYVTVWPIFALLLLSSAMMVQPATAQGYGRAYSNLPVDSNIVEGMGTSVRANTSADGDIPTTSQTRTNVGSMVYSRTFSEPYFGNTGGFGFVVPYAGTLSFDKTTNVVNSDIAGLGDASLTFDWNIYGAKAMEKEEFARAPATMYGGLHAVVTVPTGTYDAYSSSNIGSNRYAFKLTYNQSFPWNDGNTWLDFYFSGKAFSDNRSFLINNTLSQNTQWSFEAHLTQNFTPAVWGEIGAIWGGGGQAFVNQIQASGAQNNWKGVVGFGTKAWQGATIIGTYTQTLYHPANTPDVKQFMLVVMQVF
jgi:hypothetical protein